MTHNVISNYRIHITDNTIWNWPYKYNHTDRQQHYYHLIPHFIASAAPWLRSRAILTPTNDTYLGFLTPHNPPTPLGV